MAQKIARRQTIDHDFQAQFSGTCPRCGKGYAVGSVIVRTVRGFQHAVCPSNDEDDEKRK